MLDRIRTAALFGAHQLTVAIGISLFPIAIVASQHLGVNLPVHRLIETTGEAVASADN